MKESEISCDQQKERTNTLSKCESILRRGLMYKVRVLPSYFFSDSFSSSTLPVQEKKSWIPELVLWASSSHILLILDHFLLVVVNDFILVDDLPVPLPIGLVSFKGYLPSWKSTCPGLLEGTFFEPCHTKVHVMHLDFRAGASMHARHWRRNRNLSPWEGRRACQFTSSSLSNALCTG